MHSLQTPTAQYFVKCTVTPVLRKCRVSQNSRTDLFIHGSNEQTGIEKFSPFDNISEHSNVSSDITLV